MSCAVWRVRVALTESLALVLQPAAAIISTPLTISLHVTQADGLTLLYPLYRNDSSLQGTRVLSRAPVTHHELEQ
jgi:hypothetical protein